MKKLATHWSVLNSVFIDEFSFFFIHFLFLYANDICLVFRSMHVKDIEKQLNEDLASMYDWFVDNKLSIHFCEYKTKSILFASKCIWIKQHSWVTWLGCILEETMPGESTHKVISKVNAILKSLHLKNKYLTPNLRHVLCNDLTQRRFDYATDIMVS